MTVAEALAQFLVRLGVRRVHGYPGEDHMLLISTLEEAGLDYVLAGSESSACTMAAAEAEVTGVPGVAVVSFAPGLTNAMNGIASAYMDQVPLLVFAGQHPSDRRPTIIRQNLDNHALVREVVRWSVTLGRDVDRAMVRAVQVATSHPGGPVFVELAEEVAASEALDAPAADPPSAIRSTTVAAGELEELRGLVAQARTPVLIAGPGCGSDAREAIAAFAAAARAITFCTPAAKGMARPGDPWFAGTFLHGNLEETLLGQADLVLAVGVTARDVLNRPWTYGGRLAWIGDHPYTEGYLPIAIEVVGSVGAVLDALRPAPDATASTWTTDAAADHRTRVYEALEAGGSALTVASGLATLQRVVPPGVRVTVDAGFGKPIASLVWEAAEPGTYLSSHGLSTMGYALPAANAVALATGDPVLALMGDGSFLLRAADLATSTAIGVAPVCVVWADGLLAQIHVKQGRRGLRSVGTTLPSVSVTAIAAAFGARAVDARSLAELEEAAREAFASGVLTVIAARVAADDQARLFDVIRG